MTISPGFNSSHIPTSLSDLPPELIYKITQYIFAARGTTPLLTQENNLLSDFLSLSLVNLTFKKAAEAIELSPSFPDLRSVDFFTSMIKLNKPELGSRVEKITFRCETLGSIGISPFLRSLFQQCTSVREITVVDPTRRGALAVGSLDSSVLLPHLTKLNISSCYLAISPLNTFTSSSLVELNLCGVSAPSKIIHSLFLPSSLPNLKHLSIHTVTILSPQEDEGFWLTSNHLKFISPQLISQSLSIQSIKGPSFNSNKTLFDISAHPLLIRRIRFKFICQRTAQLVEDIWYIRINLYQWREEGRNSREDYNKLLLRALEDLPNLKAIFIPFTWGNWMIPVVGENVTEGEEEKELKPFLNECDRKGIRVIFEEVPDDENDMFRSKEFERMKLRESEFL